MTAADIRTLTEGLTDLCPEYLRQGIRHLQRNCSIECNHHSENETEECNQPDRYDGERIAGLLAAIPTLLTALDAVEAECATTDTETGEPLQADLVHRIRTAVSAALEGK